ncbi:DUF3300 domain-containing protein [Alteromonas sp. ASW11-36]|uniref:DUF3300 domain-containing protein n=1 Tax=Alteromonas arenosi TaxID=3055817 RepID=A0ABT7SSM3_9ALTE|nr:DUF3300 domain-containing protein [Alteromonas sp. ASW11-36]MDM7859182.1 DUF3300 domain-containing protein [Alteromonas sp. ASW11-36]
MKSAHKIAFIYALALIVSISLAIQFASASERDDQAYTGTVLTEEDLDTVLAPIALYPDTLLTHVLIASTYPMDVIRAARWRENNASLSPDEIRDRVEVFDWDMSVKALAPFDRVLMQMSEDIDWLNYLGDAVLADEEWVLERIQVLRDYAYENGSLSDSEYVSVEREDDVVVIETVKDRVVYVPYYDTRVVYGNWWHVRSPYYWEYPRHYHYSAGFYWSPSVHIASHFFFGGFHWHHRYVVINHNYYHRPYHRDYRRVYTREYQRWNHNVQHRRARYHDRVVRHREYRRNESVHAVRTRQVNVERYGAYQPAAKVRYSTQPRQVQRTVSTDRTVTRTRQTQPVRQPRAVEQRAVEPRTVQREREVTRSRTVRTPEPVTRERAQTRPRDVQSPTVQRERAVTQSRTVRTPQPVVRETRQRTQPVQRTTRQPQPVQRQQTRTAPREVQRQTQPAVQPRTVQRQQVQVQRPQVQRQQVQRQTVQPAPRATVQRSRTQQSRPQQSRSTRQTSRGHKN